MCALLVLLSEVVRRRKEKIVCVTLTFTAICVVISGVIVHFIDKKANEIRLPCVFTPTKK